MKCTYQQFELPFLYPFTISKGTKTHQPGLLVALEMGPYRGVGEATAISYYNVTVEKMVADLEKKKNLIERFAFTDPERYWHYLHHLIPDNPFLVSALDMAGWDLYGQIKKKPLYQIWNTEFTNSIVTDYTIGIDAIDTMLEKMKANPWPVYKIKMGTDKDIEIIEALRAQTSVPFRVDANAAWTLDEAVEKISALAKLGVEMVEQPLAKDDWDGMRKLYKLSELPLYADESCVFENDVEKCVDAFHGINIKLTKCSGITPARRMITKARELGLEVMMGSMNESTVGSAAVAHFIPQLDAVDVDGPLLLSEDTATGLKYDFGKVEVSGRYGLGVTIDNYF